MQVQGHLLIMAGKREKGFKPQAVNTILFCINRKWDHNGKTNGSMENLESSTSSEVCHPVFFFLFQNKYSTGTCLLYPCPKILSSLNAGSYRLMLTETYVAAQRGLFDMANQFITTSVRQNSDKRKYVTICGHARSESVTQHSLLREPQYCTSP